LSWTVYLLRCGDGTLYCGVTRDVAARLAAHESGRGARYTRGRGPLELLLTRRCRNQGNALRIELAVKRLQKREKLALVTAPKRFAEVARRALGRPTSR
jgi:putative endonuclease